MRKKIDKIDRELIKNLGKRFAVTDMIGKYKRENGVSMRDKDREETMLQQRREWAEDEQINCELVESIFQNILEKTVHKNERRQEGRD